MKKFFKNFRDKYWIRKDREEFFFTGFMLSCMIASFVITYWHYLDRVEMKPKIKLKYEDKKEIKKLKDVDYMVPLKKQSTFYKIDEYFRPDEKNN